MKKIRLSLTKIPKPNKKWLVAVVIIILLAASQWWSIRMIYNQQFKGQTALWLARVYHLSAGQAIKDEKQIKVVLYDYLINKDLGQRYVAQQLASGMKPGEVLSDENIGDAAWQKILKEAWLQEIAKQHGIKVTDQDVAEYLKGVDDLEAMKQSVTNGLKVSFSVYQKFIIKPLVLEAKVYQYMLENFNDMDGIKKAQAAYDALVKEKRDFKEVAQEYSDDMQYIGNSLFLKESQLSNFDEPIKSLEPGGYSRIVILPGDPGAYVIWRLETKTTDPETQENIYELRGIAVAAKSIGAFFNDYLSGAQINRWYK
ncbi:MAG: hypothetical protein WC465_00300 [Patescibacteria group bacterium]